ncbi:MAG: hypothetical protein FJX74_15610, partial [Armatimonadetes bacterium]|nr:hypothetical protein [Armatimonadota bacterium]
MTMLTWALSLAATAMGQPSLPWQTSTLYDEYGSQDRVLRPWTPVDCEERRLRVWGREMVWQAPSLFPASVTSGGVELLAAPMRLIATTNGRSRPLALTRFTIRERRQSRVTCTAVGEAGGLTATADLWMEYDGFLWVVLTFAQSDPAGRVDALRLEVELPRAGATLYQTFSRPHTGWIGDPPIALPWFANRAEHIANFYHWLGNEDRGLGFTYTSLQHWAPRSDEAFCTIEPGSDTVTYRVNLIESRSSLEGREFQFGIQATPIKRLPPDYHSMVSTGLDYRDWAAWKRLQDGLDSVVIWPPGHMRGLNDPDHVDADALRASVAYVHDRGLAALFTGCPQKVSPLADEFEALRGEWLVHPESVLDWEGTPHYQNCGRSASLRQWLFHGWGPGLVEACGLEGIYYDGWQTGQIACSNGRHRCGWTDAQGMRHATVPVLEGREFNQRMGMFLEDHVRSERVAPSSAPERGDFPDHHYRIHSWEFVPSVMGFATSWLTGE